MKGFSNKLKSKSRAKRVNGFRSKFENNIDKNIPNEYKEYISYETEKLEYIIESNYNPDFIIENKKTKKKIYVEAKGFFDAKDRKKILAVIKCNPSIDLRLLFQNKDNKISKGSNTTYAKWCENNGIKYEEGIYLPKSWIEEVL